ncbi:hypothetical protein UFOVP247_121 [uncultured Caudovirales phage]|uniref:Uncharacterized protein n=1 Tax=uncultured Caudovirales phage TaxID=2100421 RepID=A0A6J7WU21_9CAUD|nr:hypothetical protein UFOVP247_121 [uncultured Caudovirales phage]
MKMLILVGPQGSGNHLFAKIFSLHADVSGWEASLKPDGYFIPHWHEPFNDYWNDLSLINKKMMGGNKYAVTSVSSPYMRNFSPKIPDIVGFTSALKSNANIDSQVVVIGRDKNILDLQQRRVRGGPTWGTMQILLNNLEEPPFFVSQELLYLYRGHYLRSLEKQLDFPIEWSSPLVDKILEKDANEKYIVQCEPTQLDDHVKNFIKPPWMK